MGNENCSGANRSKKGDSKSGCACPYCEGPIEMQYPFCQVCQVDLVLCPECQKPVGKDEEACPHCGAKIEQK
jgi:hypothetical protein